MYWNKSLRRTENLLAQLLFFLVTISIVVLLGLELFNRYDRAQLAENTAHQLAMQFSLAREEAILHKQTLGFILKNHSYQFYIKSTTKEGMWLPLQTDQFLNHNALPRGIFVQVQSGDVPTKTLSTNQAIQNTYSQPATYLNNIASNSAISSTSISSSPMASNNTQPVIIFYPKGNITPFTIDVGMKNLTPNYQIIGTPTGEIDLKVYSDNFMGLPMK